MREQAELESARKRSDAAADAESELAMAKQQGREMVEEARAYRERVLSELARRRDLARQQIEQLVHGRDRLLQAFERARLVAVDVTAELSPLGEPDEYVDLSPTTGPVPIMVPSGRIGDATSIDDFVPRTPETDEPDVDPAAEDPAAEDPVGEEHARPPTSRSPVRRPTARAPLVRHPTATDEDDTHALVFPFPPQPAVADDEQDELGDTVGAGDAGESGDEIDDDDVTATDVDALFAKLRANPPTEPDPALDDAESAALDDVEETPFRARDAVLVPLIVAAARKLKRVLADEQNDVLDTLRNREPVRDVDALVPPVAHQAARYGDAITAELVSAVRAGAAAVAAASDLDIDAEGPLAAVGDQITDALVGPLRERLERAVADGDGSNEAITKRVRGVYREWKTQRIDEQLDDTFRLAYCQGALVALGTGTPVTWTVDPDGPPSPDCEDNGLAGAVAAGDAFPSGHVSPPMHPGCRCLLLPVDR